MNPIIDRREVFLKLKNMFEHAEENDVETMPKEEDKPLELYCVNYDSKVSAPVIVLYKFKNDSDGVERYGNPSDPIFGNMYYDRSQVEETMYNVYGSEEDAIEHVGNGIVTIVSVDKSTYKVVGKRFVSYNKEYALHEDKMYKRAKAVAKIG